MGPTTVSEVRAEFGLALISNPIRLCKSQSKGVTALLKDTDLHCSTMWISYVLGPPKIAEKALLSIVYSYILSSQANQA